MDQTSNPAVEICFFDGTLAQRVNRLDSTIGASLRSKGRQPAPRRGGNVDSTRRGGGQELV